jgi:hypothetical protein
MGGVTAYYTGGKYAELEILARDGTDDIQCQVLFRDGQFSGTGGWSVLPK